MYIMYFTKALIIDAYDLSEAVSAAHPELGQIDSLEMVSILFHEDYQNDILKAFNFKGEFYPEDWDEEDRPIVKAVAELLDAEIGAETNTVLINICW